MSSDSGPSLVSVIVPTFNGKAWLARCLDAVVAQKSSAFALEVIVVDDGSTDESIPFVRERYGGDVRVIALGRNQGFAAAVNRGIVEASGPQVLLLNNDTEMRPGCLDALLRALESAPSHVAAVQAKMLRMDDPARIDDAGDELFWTGAARKTGHGEPESSVTGSREIFSPCAGASLYRRSFLDELGGFDERFVSYFEDVDLGFRGRLLGYAYRLEPSAEVLHHGQGTGLSRERYVRLMTRNRLLLFAKNVPAPLLLRHSPSLLYGQIWFFRAYGKWLDSLRGYLSFLPALPHVLSERWRIQSTRRVPLDAIDRMLRPGMPS